MVSHYDPNQQSFQGFFFNDPDTVGKLQQQVKGKAVQMQSEMDF